MPTDDLSDGVPRRGGRTGGAFDRGLLSPVTAQSDAGSGLDDAAFARCLVAAEVALTRAWAELGVAPVEAAEAVSAAFGIGPEAGVHGDTRFAVRPADDALSQAEIARLSAESASGGNPVIPLVALMRDRVPEHARGWVHRGATSQDIMDTALMLLAQDAISGVLVSTEWAGEHLVRLAAEHRDRVAVARTLTQHAVPTKMGLRFANWERGLRRATDRLCGASELPVQLGGAAGTMAAFLEIGGAEAAAALPAAFADELLLDAPDAPWHTARWPITELGDALVQVTDALGVIAADVATLSRTEIGELAEGGGGGSSAMPQKRNPARAVLIRSAAIRAPHLAATLHTAAALAVDERPDGAWHAEWPTLRELLRITLGAAVNAELMLSDLVVDGEAVARNLGLSRGLILAERLSIVLAPIIGADRVRYVIDAAGAGGDLAALLRVEPGVRDAGIDIDELLDPAGYTGFADKMNPWTFDDDPEETP